MLGGEETGGQAALSSSRLVRASPVVSRPPSRASTTASSGVNLHRGGPGVQLLLVQQVGEGLEVLLGHLLLRGLLAVGLEGGAQGVGKGLLEELAHHRGHVQVGEGDGDGGRAGAGVLLGGDHLPGEVPGHGLGQGGGVLGGEVQLLPGLGEVSQVVQVQAVGVPVLGQGQHVQVPQGGQALLCDLLGGGPPAAAGGQAEQKGQAHQQGQKGSFHGKASFCARDGC